MKKLVISITFLLMAKAMAYAVESIGPDYLFVINFDNGTYEKGKLALNGNGQSNVIYFSDRPKIEAGGLFIQNSAIIKAIKKVF